MTTTDLRTQSSQLVQSLQQGKKVSLVHRSQIIGEIVPITADVKPFDIKKFRTFVKIRHKKDLSYKERERIYRQHLEEKYGKDIS